MGQLVESFINAISKNVAPDMDLKVLHVYLIT